MGRIKLSSIKRSSYITQEKHSLDKDDQDPPLEFSLDGSLIGRSKSLIENFTRYDGMMSKEVKQVKVIEIISIKEVSKGSLDDPNKMRYVCF